MKKSKIIYLFNVILFIIMIDYYSNYKYISKYSNEILIIGTIIEKKVNDNNVTLVINGKEKVLVNCYDCDFNYNVGDIIEFGGYFKEINENTNFDLFNYKEYLLSKKIYKNFIFKDFKYIKTSKNFIYKIYNVLEKRIEKMKSKEFLKAMILGNTSLFESDIYDIYKINGIVHLFAISGMHVVIITSILLGILSKISKFKKMNYFLTFIILIIYMFIINSASIIRSVLMFITCYLNKIFKTKLTTLNILYYIFAINFFINPYVIYNMGFKLSYLISLTLIISKNKISKYKNYISQTFITSLISFFASFPLIINSNFEINILTPIINVIVISVVSIILFPLALLTVIFPSLDQLLSFLLTGFNKLNEFLAFNSFVMNVPKMNMILIIIYYLIFLLFIYKTKYVTLIIFFILLLNNKVYFNPNTCLTVLDVGQGDSMLLTYP